MTKNLPGRIKKDGEPAARPRTMAERAFHLTELQRLAMGGASAAEMAEELGLTLVQVRSDLASINREWLKTLGEDSAKFKAIMLRKLMQLESLSLEAFAESKEKTIVDRATESGDDGTGKERNARRTIHSAGDSSFLTNARESIKLQMQLLGLDGKIHTTETFDKEGFLDLVAEKIAEVKAAATAVPAMAAEVKEIGNVDSDSSPFV